MGAMDPPDDSIALALATPLWRSDKHDVLMAKSRPLAEHARGRYVDADFFVVISSQLVVVWRRVAIERQQPAGHLALDPGDERVVVAKIVE